MKSHLQELNWNFFFFKFVGYTPAFCETVTKTILASVFSAQSYCWWLCCNETFTSCSGPRSYKFPCLNILRFGYTAVYVWKYWRKECCVLYNPAWSFLSFKLTMILCRTFLTCTALAWCRVLWHHHLFLRRLLSSQGHLQRHLLSSKGGLMFSHGIVSGG